MSLKGAIVFFVWIVSSFYMSAKDERPNIVFIMSDDHAYQAISAYNGKLNQTPNIDRIAKKGMIFKNACVTNSICAPSRAVILTGKHSHINGKIDNIFPFDTTNITFPQILQKSGYQTAMFGKLHFGNNPKGFDQFKILPGQGVYYNPDFITKNEGNVRISGYVTDIITDMTLDWLKKERKKDKPFFLAYLHKAPHREWLPAERHYKTFLHKKFPEPKTLFDDYKGRGRAAKESEMHLLHHMNWAGDNKIFPETMDKLNIKEVHSYDKTNYNYQVNRMNPNQREEWDKAYGKMNREFEKLYPKMNDKAKLKWKYQRYMQDYLGCIAAVDEGVGKVLDYLENEGLDQNTIVIYTSDQGFYLGEHGWYDKRYVYDESFKTPLLIQWPGFIKNQSTCNKMVQNLDFAQTFLEVAGITPPTDMQGESLIPLFKNPEGPFREAVYYHYYEYPAVHMVKRHYAIVTEEYKLIHFYYDINEWELYDRKKDKYELKNQYYNPRYKAVRDDLKNRLADMRIKYKDSEVSDQMFIEKYKNL